MKTPFSRFIRTTAAVLWFLILGGFLGAAPQPRVVCFALSPFISDTQGVPGGMAVEMVEKILQKAGLEVPIQLVPLSRAVQDLDNGNTILVMLGRTPERESKYQWICPLYEDSFSFATLAPARALNSYEEGQAAANILVMFHAASEAVLHKKGFTNLDNSAETEDVNLKKLLAGRASGWFGSTASIKYLVKTNKLSSTVTLGTPVQPLPFWVTASKDLAPDLVVRLQAAAKALKAEGVFESIFAPLN